MLAKMLVNRENLMLREDWQQIMRDKVRRERRHREQIRKISKRTDEIYTWWHDDK
jgi:hypothetical protein